MPSAVVIYPIGSLVRMPPGVVACLMLHYYQGNNTVSSTLRVTIYIYTCDVLRQKSSVFRISAG